MYKLVKIAQSAFRERISCYEAEGWKLWLKVLVFQDTKAEFINQAIQLVSLEQIIQRFLFLITQSTKVNRINPKLR